VYSNQPDRLFCVANVSVETINPRSCVVMDRPFLAESLSDRLLSLALEIQVPRLSPSGLGRRIPDFLGLRSSFALFFSTYQPRSKGKNQYGNIGTSVLPCHVPGRYNTLRSVSFVLGSAMLVWASIASILLTGTYHILFKKIDQAISLNAGKVLTTGDVQALHLAHRMNEFYLVLLCVAAIAGAIGGILLYLSNNFRWRLKEKDE